MRRSISHGIKNLRRHEVVIEPVVLETSASLRSESRCSIPLTSSKVAGIGIMHETRQSLLLRAQTGEADAWKDLTDLYRPLIIGWLNRQGVPAVDLEDLSQDVLLSVVKHLPELRALRPPGRVPLLAAHHRLQPHDRLLAGHRRGAPRPAAAAAPPPPSSRSPTPTAT